MSHKCVVLPSKCFTVLQDIALLGLTDVWSAIRKETTSRFGLLLDLLMLEQMKELFQSLIDVRLLRYVVADVLRIFSFC